MIYFKNFYQLKYITKKKKSKFKQYNYLIKLLFKISLLN